MTFVYSNAKNYYEQAATGVVDTISTDTIASATTNTDLSLSGAGSGNVRITDALETNNITGYTGNLTISSAADLMLSGDNYVATDVELVVGPNGVSKVWCQLIDARSYDDQEQGNLGLYTEPENGSILLWTDVLQTCDHTNVAGGGVDSAVTGYSGMKTVRNSAGDGTQDMYFVNGLFVGYQADL